MRTTDSRDLTPYFRVVFDRKERKAEEKAAEGFEMVGGREALRHEDFPTVPGGRGMVLGGRCKAGCVLHGGRLFIYACCGPPQHFDWFHLFKSVAVFLQCRCMLLLGLRAKFLTCEAVVRYLMLPLEHVLDQLTMAAEGAILVDVCRSKAV